MATRNLTQNPISLKTDLAITDLLFTSLLEVFLMYAHIDRKVVAR